MLFRNIRLYFSKRKLIRLYKVVQDTANEKESLRYLIQSKGKVFTKQLDYIKNKYGIDNPKAIVSDRLHVKLDKELFLKKSNRNS